MSSDLSALPVLERNIKVINIGSGHLKISFSPQRRFICPDGQRAEDKIQTQKIEDAELVYLSPKVGGLLLDRHETDVLHRKMTVPKGKKENPMLG